MSSVVTSTSMQSRPHDVAIFRHLVFLPSLSCYIMLLCFLVASSRYMHILMNFIKSVLKIWLCSIHSCLYLLLWSSLACNSHGLLLLNIVVGRLLTWSAFLPCVLLVIHAPYERALAMFSFTNVSSHCWLPCDAMKFFVVSGMILQSGYHESVSAMSCFSTVCNYSYHLPCLHWCYHQLHA